MLLVDVITRIVNFRMTVNMLYTCYINIFKNGSLYSVFNDLFVFKQQMPNIDNK
jgi:hypothetical protein